MALSLTYFVSFADAASASFHLFSAIKVPTVLVLAEERRVLGIANFTACQLEVLRIVFRAPDLNTRFPFFSLSTGLQSKISATKTPVEMFVKNLRVKFIMLKREEARANLEARQLEVLLIVFRASDVNTRFLLPEFRTKKKKVKN